MKKIYVGLCLLILFSTSALFSADMVPIAVLDLTPKGVPKRTANAVSDMIRSKFVNIGNFVVVERSQMKEILSEQGLQMTGCTDSSCAVQLGKILSAQKIIVGEINSIDKKIILTIRYVDVQSGSAMFSATAMAPSIDEIQTATDDVVQDLAEKIVSGDKDVIVPKTKLGYYARAIVPGWGQLYADRDVKGYIFFGALALSAGFTGYTAYNNYAKQKDYEDYEGTQSEMDKKYETWEDASMLLNYSFIAIGAVVLINWIDILFISSPGFEENSVEPKSAFFGGGDNFYSGRSPRHDGLDPSLNSLLRGWRYPQFAPDLAP